jgi:outer membrane protein OmpU
MKNIIKTVIVMLTSISLFGSANAGELAVSGTAKATYNVISGIAQGKGLGITNELNFTASGELDNGYTWSYSMELDPADTATGGAATNDDSKMTLTTPFGTVGIFVLEGGLDLEDGASQSVYARPTDIGDPSATVDNYTIDSYNNLQYHTAKDMLPYGLSLKVAYAPDLDTTNNSGNQAGVNHNEETAAYAGRNATEYQIKANPIEGLNVGASYFEFDKAGMAKQDQEPESGSVMATYAIGNFTTGYSRARRATLIADSANTGVDDYDQANFSLAMAVNDNLSVSYEREKSKANQNDDATADVEQATNSVQLAYNMGGMTIALVQSSHDNVGYVEAADRDQTLLAISLAF